MTCHATNPARLFARVCPLLLAGALLLPLWGAASAGPQNTDWAARGLEFVQLLQAGRFEEATAQMTPKMRSYFKNNPLSSLWEKLTAQVGPLEKIKAVHTARLDSLWRVEVISQFARADLAVRVVFDPHGKVAGLWFLPAPPEPYEVPDYADTTAFTEKELEFGISPFRLKGTLSLPRSPGPHPGVVLVAGSGPNDRDETVGPNRPFRDLAWGLASRGIAVFRYEKRTRLYAQKLDPHHITVEEEVIQDALEALKTLRRQQGVDSSSVFLLGHSLGAMLAPEIAYRDGHVRGVILLAAPARKFAAVLRSQLTYLRSLRRQDPAARAQFDSLLALVDRLEKHALPDTAMVMGAPASYYYDLDRRPAVNFARRLNIPLLILQGGRDYQVTREDFQLWQKELAGKANVQLRFFPDLNHLFLRGKGMATPEEYLTLRGHVARGVIEEIARFVRRVLGR